jgi:predicted hydrocarbon binding protein
MERGKHFLSNRKARIYLDTVAEVSGQYGFEAVLQLAGLQTWIHQRPPHNDASEVDYADFAALNATLIRMYGLTGGRTLALRAGRNSFMALTERLAAILDIDDAAFQAQPPTQRVKALLEAIVEGGGQLGIDHISLRAAGDQFLYTVQPCPICWKQSNFEDAICFSTVGFLQQAIEWVGAGDYYLVEEASCAATKTTKDATCVFAILKVD